MESPKVIIFWFFIFKLNFSDSPITLTFSNTTISLGGVQLLCKVLEYSVISLEYLPRSWLMVEVVPVLCVYNLERVSLVFFLAKTMKMPWFSSNL